MKTKLAIIEIEYSLVPYSSSKPFKSAVTHRKDEREDGGVKVRLYHHNLTQATIARIGRVCEAAISTANA